MARIKRLSFWQRMDRFPPILVRLLTVYRSGRAQWCPTDQEIAETSGLTIAQVKRISWSTSWDDLPLASVKAFLTGCRVDLEQRRTFRRLEWMRRSGVFRHLRKSDLWKTQLKEMAEVYVAFCET